MGVIEIRPIIMQKTSKLLSLSAWVRASTIAAVLTGNFCYTALADNLPVSNTGCWVLSEATDYVYNKDSASRSLTPKEAALRHTLSITVAQNVINSFTFKVGCMIESATPIFELKVSGLDIRIFDSINDFVYARFMVDDNQEYSLRGDIMSSDRIMFVPSTSSQDKNLSDLFLQMREGGTLKIGLLQGENSQVREYKVPLAGFMEYSDQILQSCQNYHQYSTDQMQFLPDYITKEPEGYAPKNYSLKQVEQNVVDPNAPVPVAPMPEVTPPPQPQTPHEILPFAPDGGPASIGPDGRPIGAESYHSFGSSEHSYGPAQGPMQIGPDGTPVAPAAQGAAPAAPVPAPAQGPNMAAPVPADTATGVAPASPAPAGAAPVGATQAPAAAGAAPAPAAANGAAPAGNNIDIF